MYNVFEGKEKVEKITQNNESLHQSNLPVGVVDQRNMHADLVVIKFGTVRPDGNSDIKAFFNTSSGVLSLWNGTAWLTTTLS